ncbi:S8 family serine peptidase [Mycoplasma sp. BRA285]
MKNKIIKFLSLLGVVISPTIVLSTSITTSVNETTNQNEKKIKLNSNNSYEITEFNSHILQEFYRPYYDKLGLKYHLDNQYKEGDSLDLNSPYNKVGIIEVDDSDLSYLPSRLNGFKIEKDAQKPLDIYSELDFESHGMAVSSIIGSDIGINKKAHIYFTSLNNYLVNNNLDRYKKAFEYMKNNDVKVVNLSLAFIKKWSNWDEMEAKKTFDKKINKEFNRTIGKVIDGNWHTDIHISDKWQFEKKIDIKNIENYKNKIQAWYFIENLFYTLRLINNTAEISNLESSNKNLVKLFDEYAKKYHIKFVVSAGNDNIIRNVISEYQFDFKENYENFKDYIIYLYQTYCMNYDYEKLNNNSEISNKLMYIVQNIKEVSKLFLPNATDDGSKYLDNILRKEEKIFSFKNAQNIIYVGAVDYNNIPTIFTEYNVWDTDVLPFVSAYGEFSYKDFESIKEKLGYEATREAKKLLFNQNLWKNNISHSSLSKKYKIKDYYLLSPDQKISFLVNSMLNFCGTSMAAPMITGLISLLQTKNQRIFNLSEIKTLLAASSTYADTYTTIFNLDSMKPKWETWKANRSKSKTGYGIPKYFKMQKFLDNNMLKTFVNDFNANSHYGRFLLHEANEKIKLDHNINKIITTISFISFSIDEILSSEDFMDFVDDDKKYLISIFLKEYTSLKENNELENILNNDRNILDIFSIAFFNKTQRLKKSNSSDSNTEKINFGKFKSSNVNLELCYEPLQLERIQEILEKCTKLDKDDIILKSLLLKNKENVLKAIRKAYAKYATHNMKITYIREVE